MIYEGFEGFKGFEGFEGFEGLRGKREKPLTLVLRLWSSPPYIYDKAIGLGP